MGFIECKAYGKVNLGLDVTGRRADGYHLVKMIMQTVDICDFITVSSQDGEEPVPETLFNRNAKSHSICDSHENYQITITCDHPDVPTDQRNLAYKAASKICESYALKGRIHIDIRKNIPVEAGMAGGSADAAAVILAMDQLFDLRMDEQEKDRIAVSLGADVPFCLRKGTYLSEGIGEKLSRIGDLTHCFMIIVKPDFSVSTAWAYRELDCFIQKQQKEGIVVHPDIDGLMDAITCRDIMRIADRMDNILEQVVIPSHPEIQEIKDALLRFGALGALMSGSGPTVFGIFKDREKADYAFSHLGGGCKIGKFEVEF